MDINKYEELLDNWIPEDEEEKIDQQRYIRASMEFRYMDIKEKLDDDVYQRMYEEVLRNEENLSEEQRAQFRLIEQFENNHVRQSEYDAKVEELAQILDEIDNKYGISQQQQMSEFEEEVKRKRKALRAYQTYNHNNGQYGIMRNVNVDSLSNNEIMEMYNVVSVTEKFDEYVRLGNAYIEKEELAKKETELNRIKDEKRKNIEELRRQRGVVSESTSSAENNGESEVSLSDIETELNRFRDTSNRINNQMNEVNRKLAIGDIADLDVTDAINGLDTEINELREMGKVILDDMDEFRRITESADFSMSPSEVKNTVDNFISRFKGLKVMQQQKYNARVEWTNNKIDELKAMPDLDDEVRAMIGSLTKLDKSDNVISQWKQKNYLNNIDYNKLVEVNKQIIEIQNRLGLRAESEFVNSLDADINNIENEVIRIGSEVVPDLTVSDIDRLNQDLKLVSANVKDFRLKLESKKDEISEEDYNKYIMRVEDAEADLAYLYAQLKSLNKGSEGKNKDYEDLNKEVTSLSVDVDRLNIDVDAFRGHINDGGKLVFEGKLKDLKDRLDALVAEIESKKDNMEVSQYDALMNKVNDMRTKLSNIDDKIKDPGMIKDADIFALLNGEIDGLESALTNLEQQIENLDKPIKREDRKKIDTIVKHLEKEIKRLEKLLDQYKDKDSDKYNATMERLNGLKDRLDKIGKKYREKCPLMVRAVKSAKNFFKKHKKACLIIAGLAAMAIVSYHVLIPAIMHGNIMIAGTSPALRPFIKFTNNILGGMIGASRTTDGLWFLANGVRINPSCAATSLLKGLAISGIGSTVLVAPLVVAIKKLVEKMKTAELKQKLGESFEKGKEKIKEKIPTKKEKSDKKTSTKKADKMSVEELAKLLKEYRKSGKSMDDFCMDNELSEEEKNVLQYLESRSKNNMEEMKNSGRKGR